MKVAWMAVAVLAGGAAAAGAEEAPPGWLLAAEGGWQRLHEDDGAAGALRISRKLDRGDRFRLQAGLVFSSMYAFDVGAEVRFCRSCRVSPVLGVGSGIMTEPEYGDGSYIRATAGIEAALSPRVVLRATVQAGSHDGESGPHAASLGIGWRF